MTTARPFGQTGILEQGFGGDPPDAGSSRRSKIRQLGLLRHEEGGPELRVPPLQFPD